MNLTNGGIDILTIYEYPKYQLIIKTEKVEYFKITDAEFNSEVVKYCK